jgi:hypothetical protein
MKDNHSLQDGGQFQAPSPSPKPPSKAELLTAINERIIGLLGGADEAWRGRVKDCLYSKDCQPSNQDDLKDLIERWYLGYPEINMLSILDEAGNELQTDPKFTERAGQASEIYMIFSMLIWRFRQGLKRRYDSFPPETWDVKMALRTLSDFTDYPLDEKLDRDLITKAIRRFPDIDLIGQIDRKILWWQEHPEALKSENKSPRMQLWQWFELEDKFQRKKAENTGG